MGRWQQREGAAQGRWLGPLLSLIVLAVLSLALHGWWSGQQLSAAGGGPVGYVDVGRLIDDYLAPMVDGPLTSETLRLQAEFEAAARTLDEAATEELFEQYQAMLNLVKHDLIEEQLPAVNEAIAAVAQREAVTVVLDKQSVLHGGVDLTELVLHYLHQTAQEGGL